MPQSRGLMELQYKDQAEQYAQEEANEEYKAKIDALPFMLKPLALRELIVQNDDTDFSGATEGDR